MPSVDPLAGNPNLNFLVFMHKHCFCLSESRGIHSSDIVMSSEMFHLEWDRFRENLISSIENFKEKDFSDVVLACEDRQVGVNFTVKMK